jgi:pyruvate carboxylase
VWSLVRVPLQVNKGLPPVAAYLGYDDIIRVAKEAGVDAIHPG